MRTATNLDKVLSEMGFSLECTLTGDDLSAENPTGQNHWSVTISYNGRSFATDFHQGCAFREYRGRRAKMPSCRNSLRWEEYTRKYRPSRPVLSDVLHCLVSDAACVCYGQAFKDFCEEFGCSNDSIKARDIYDGCRDIFMGLLRLGVDLEGLQDLFQDY